MQLVKRRFFAMRNGVIADALRRAGSPFRIIFGLNLPQISEIAADIPPSYELADELWNNSSTRESMLLATMIMPKDALSVDKSMQWIASVSATEVADVLCHRLLKHAPFALDLAYGLSRSDRDMDRYVAIRLMFNIVSAHPSQALEMARLELLRECRLTHRVAEMLVQEAEFLLPSA